MSSPNIESCLFPCITSSTSSSPDETIVYWDKFEWEVRISDVSLLQSLMHSWAIVLAKYTDSETLRFGNLSGSTGIQTCDEISVEEYEASVNSAAYLSDAVSLISRKKCQIHEWKCRDRINTCVATDLHPGWLNDWKSSSNHGIQLLLVATQQEWPCISLYGKAGLVDKSSIRYLSTALQYILQSTLERPQELLQSFALTPDNHYRQIRDWNKHILEEPFAQCIHDIFQDKCSENPDAEAINAWDGAMSYASLDQESARIMNLLRLQGAGPETIVPLVFEKSKWTVVAMLGVLKAGAAFVLLEPSHPLERLQSICQDVRARVLLTSELHKSVGLQLADNVISVPSDNENGAPYRDKVSPSQIQVKPGNAAYVAFTSGSTGKPKGVVVEHGSFCTNAMVSSEAQNLNGSSRVLQFASYAFDVSIHESLVPLMLGGCVCIPSASDRVDCLEYAILQLRVNWMELTPSVARLLSPQRIPAVKTLVVGGESIAPSEVSRWAPYLRLAVAYGPAECTVVSLVHPNFTKDADPFSIGWACGGSVWVVEPEDHNKLVPIGAVGELVIGGPIVGRGYLHRPEQTAAAFIQNPRWHRSENSRFYKTGDLVRQRTDGSVSFLGRKDTQVKLRGQRIELGEIENQAAEFFPGAAIAVEVGKLYHGHSSLVMFVEWSSSKEEKRYKDKDSCRATHKECYRFWPRALRAKTGLAKILPSYMVPDLMVPLCAIPLSPTGKVDRKALRSIISSWSREEIRKYQPTASSLSSKERHHGPAAPEATQQMINIVARVLSLNESDINEHDSFFQLGGDSISAMMLAQESESIPFLQFTVADIFQSVDISELARRAHTMTREKTPRECSIPNHILPFSLLSPGKVDAYVQIAAEHSNVDASQIEDIYPCSPLQARLMARTAKQPGAFQGRFTFKLSPGLDKDRLRWAWNRAANSLSILRTRIIHAWQLGAESFLQVVVRDKDIEWIEAGTRSESEVKRSMSFGSPLIYLVALRAKLIPTLTVVIHHSLFDLVVFQQILTTVETAYRGEALLSQPFAPFIKYLGDLNVPEASDFWKREFAGLKAVPLPSNKNFTRSKHLAISWTRRRSLLPDPSPLGTTTSLLIRLAWAMVLSQYTGTLDVVFGITVMGRSMSGTVDVKGPTIATYPLRVTLHGDRSVSETLRCIHDQAMSVAPFEQTGMQRIRQCGREAASACEFQSMLIVQPPLEKTPLGRKGTSQLMTLDETGSWKHKSYTSFSTQALSVVCEPSADHLETTAYFDRNIIKSHQVTDMLRSMNRILRLLVGYPDAPLRRLLKKCPPTCDLTDNRHESVSLACLEEAASGYLGPGIPVIADWVTPQGSQAPSLALFVGVVSLDTLSDDCSVLAKVEEPLRTRLIQLMRELQQRLLGKTVRCCCVPVSLCYKPSVTRLLLDRSSALEAAAKLTWASLISWQSSQDSIASEDLLPVEVGLRHALATVLQLKPREIGVEDDLVSLGCDSLVAMQFAAQCNLDGIQVTVADIFQAKSLRSLALMVKGRPAQHFQSTALARFSLLKPTYENQTSFEQDIFTTVDSDRLGKATEDAFPCTPSHLGLLSELGNCQSHTIWEVGGPDERINPTHLGESWLKLVEHHPALRTLLLPSLSNPAQMFHVMLKKSLDAVEILTDIDDSIILEIARRPRLSSCDKKGLPYKFTIFQSTSGRVLCKLEGRYAFLDANSVIILLTDLRRSLQGITLSDSTVSSYSSWVSFQQSWAKDPSHLHFWDQYLANLHPCILAGAVAHDRSAVLPHSQNHERKFAESRYRGQMRSHHQTLLQDTRALREWCDQRGVTITNVIQVAWALVLSEQTARDDVCFGALVSGRDAPVPHIGNMLGSLFNVLACRITVQSGPDHCVLNHVLQANRRSMGERASHQFCSLSEVTRRILGEKESGAPSSLFNTCLSVEQPLTDQTGPMDGCFRVLETVEETEYDMVVAATVLSDRIDAQLMFWDSFCDASRAADLGQALAQAVEQIMVCDGMEVCA
ncbi:amino acid adenylation domain-containing protein [Aspergillus aculeatinus CBS 121060]|uniref:Amino acid adenylation domain-containing protein n=1 Tax=Aspergillus aculeatinus CBS 121060 TaxID=1448322 RepID=A0ACD1GVK3_9EURO|nr:amino acid adenylation domain-containing protein [Aspergillus aculeatinus CBS 121060]RAH65475.1 amino acid adenylation domain-containing protein [Aspergillus aculeatinus CBS 121060]